MLDQWHGLKGVIIQACQSNSKNWTLSITVEIYIWFKIKRFDNFCLYSRHEFCIRFLLNSSMYPESNYGPGSIAVGSGRWWLETFTIWSISTSQGHGLPRGSVQSDSVVVHFLTLRTRLEVTAQCLRDEKSCRFACIREPTRGHRRFLF